MTIEQVGFPFKQLPSLAFESLVKFSKLQLPALSLPAQRLLLSAAKAQTVSKVEYFWQHRWPAIEHGCPLSYK